MGRKFLPLGKKAFWPKNRKFSFFPTTKKLGQLNDSRAQNAARYSFGLAEDRFRTGKFNVPAPESYAP